MLAGTDPAAGMFYLINNHIYYNFARIHRTVRMSPAMAAGVTQTLWTVRDIVTLLEEREAREAA